MPPNIKLNLNISMMYSFFRMSIHHANYKLQTAYTNHHILSKELNSLFWLLACAFYLVTNLHILYRIWNFGIRSDDKEIDFWCLCLREIEFIAEKAFRIDMLFNWILRQTERGLDDILCQWVVSTFYQWTTFSQLWTLNFEAISHSDFVNVCLHWKLWSLDCEKFEKVFYFSQNTGTWINWTKTLIGWQCLDTRFVTCAF